MAGPGAILCFCLSTFPKWPPLPVTTVGELQIGFPYANDVCLCVCVCGGEGRAHCYEVKDHSVAGGTIAYTVCRVGEASPSKAGL